MTESFAFDGGRDWGEGEANSLRDLTDNLEMVLEMEQTQDVD